MNNLIKKKRDSLEQFLHEQTIGPGASGYRYVKIDIDTKSQFFDNPLKKQQPIDYKNEVINTVPAAIYSTGILFPKEELTEIEDSSNSNEMENSREKDESDEISDNNFEKNNDEDLEEVSDLDSNLEDTAKNSDIILNTNQMFPTSMGITCALNKNVSEKDLIIKVSFRYYKKIPNKELNQFGLLLEMETEIFNKILSDFGKEHGYSNLIEIKSIGQNNILIFEKQTQKVINEFHQKLRDFDKLKAKELFPSDYSYGVSSAKKQIFQNIQNNDLNEEELKVKQKILINLEQIESFILHLKDLLNITNSKSYGLFEASNYNIDVNFPTEIPKDFIGKKFFNFNEYDSLKNIFEQTISNSKIASLSINFQVSKDSRLSDNKIFLKTQLVNTSTPFRKVKDSSRYYSAYNEDVNNRSFFGVEISIESSFLTPYNGISKLKKNNNEFDEDSVTKFIYKKYENFGIGHGCSVTHIKNGKKIKVQSTFLPTESIPDIEAIPKSVIKPLIKENDYYVNDKVYENSKVLQFKWLSSFSNTDDSDIITSLKEFVNEYDKWISFKNNQYGNTEFKDIAIQELTKCLADKNRMLKNISLIEGEENKNRLKSFRLMNSAMFMQLWHNAKKSQEGFFEKIFSNLEFDGFNSSFYKNVAKDNLFSKNESAAWRPFQLAFILLNLDGIFQHADDPGWFKRNNLVDLVWFPTGGGKTEAYLGIIALTIINRRYQNPKNGGGTAVIMRYTLRMLTLQQFQRATTLIMALELLRRNSLIQGEEPIYIGMWVGMGSLPNSLVDLENEYKNIKNAVNNNYTPHSKHPLNQCPWCGTPLFKDSISFEWIKDRNQTFDYNRIKFYCNNKKCSFSNPKLRSQRRIDHGSIPASICDEEIYQHPPALLFGTVDKFAQLAHKVSNRKENRHKDSRRLFGKGNWENGKPSNGYLPPDLIIQDELHLLQGPLGSAVALFESAVERLSTNRNGIGPKIISSTATTRNTSSQIQALFNKSLNIFPKPGVESDDSFFAFYKRKYLSSETKNPEFISKRKYIGFLPTGKTQIWMQMRIAAILMVHRAIFELQFQNKSPFFSKEYDESLKNAMDYFHTIVSYFNSLREVGKTESQINTYILKDIRRVFNRVIRPGNIMHALYTYNISKAELTGRLSGEEVKSELGRVSSKLNLQSRFTKSNPTPDFVIATNMISVGIDISRFNQMIMNSMPRNIAEYIQATSRVARDDLGLVLTVHHPFRARDISHYEKFIEFHQKMYSYVEPISITPFTKKAVDRYLSLYLATIVRHLSKFTDREDANKIFDYPSDELVELLYSYFEERKTKYKNISIKDDELLTKSNLEYIKKWIAEAINEWVNFKLPNDFKLAFKKAPNAKKEKTLFIDIDEYDDNIFSRKWRIPQSLRVVESQAIIKIEGK